MNFKLLYQRYLVAIYFFIGYLILATFVRTILAVISIDKLELSIYSAVKIFGKGFLFDCTVGISFLSVYILYLTFFPSKWIGTTFDIILNYFILSLLFFIVLFSFFAEFPFWDEFNTRFNFIAVDYLIYTYEVVANINQSFPIPVILLILLSIILIIFYFLRKHKIFQQLFSSKPKFSNRFSIFFVFILIEISLLTIVENKSAEWSTNTYENELSKNGVFSFFAAYRSNELDYDLFYVKLDKKLAYQIVKTDLLSSGEKFTSKKYDDISRVIEGTDDIKPNIILICIESLSADFLKEFGNSEQLTTTIDQLANEGILFKNMYATGTRTVRGMEALTLCVPPTPGNSIVRRQNNDNLFSVATVLKQKGYQLDFIYGGDGYFDNMNTFFGGQGFDINDRDRGNPLSDEITTKRTSIPDSEVTFENAWGICDEDIYYQSLKKADLESASNHPFFQFIMTTSNHKPYTFPDNKINLKQGNREAAVKYTDFALGQFIKQAKTKKWFSNTVFVIVADHCASSAGKWEINVDKHHIPAIIYNLNQKNEKIDKLVSQIDVMPTLFGYLNWKYNSSFFGKDISKMNSSDERAFMGNYRTLGLLEGTTFTEINDRKKVIQYHWNSNNKVLEPKKIINDSLRNKTISYYQIASERFKNGKMKVR
ncbi:alkaline phosphatase family protein [Flavobacterium piscinae]|uniref:Alkaline phosphatase family protein n=1 Tax=Flavobacterium piscinae TaxID=2506424 RepID=A0A4Q1KHH8_9FLAO|nr:alkaline phosphatase family protein [Flavobacterium piscinae]RXR28710.1 alkaline phosphatase family protein [Flavobacterium piscinae]